MAARQKQPWDTDRQQRLAELLRAKMDPQLSNDKIAGNEGNRQISSGIIGDLFNVLTRPAHAISGAAYNATDNNPDTSVVGGVTSGLSGHGQHNWADVLDNLGLKNRVARSVLGFAGDVALDPLTYVGIKGEKGLNATEALSQAARDVTERSATKDFGMDVASQAARLQAENPSHLYVSFAGKKITPDFVKPSEIAQVIKDKAIGPEFERRNIAKMFSRDSEMGSYLADKARIYESGSSAGFEGHQHAIRDNFGHLTPDEAKKVTFALEDGTDLSSVPVTKGSRNGLHTLEDYKNLARQTLDKFWNDEVAIGLHKDAEKADNYVYKFYQEGIPESHPGLPKTAAVRLEQRTGQAATELKKLSLQNAEKAGLKPLTDVGDMLAQRAASHYRQVGRAQLVKDAIETFGVPLTDSNKEWLTAARDKAGENWIPADSSQIASPIAKAFDGANMYMPQKVVKVLNQTERILSDTTTGNQFMRWYDNITRKWKFMNTMVNPGYWIRNSMSDGIMNFADGVTNPKYYDQAFRTLMEHRQNNSQELLNLLQDGAEAGSVKGTKIAFGAGSPHEIRIDAHDAWNGFLQGGGKSGDIITNIQQIDPMVKEGLGNYVNKSVQGAGQMTSNAGAKLADWNNLREDFFRLAHHYSVVDEAVRRGVPYEQAIMDAGKRVRKFNIDYGNLSSFERKSVRRVIPFYSWMRRNVPLQVELMLTRPGLIAGYAKGNDLMQGLLGTDNGNGDYLVPKWIRDSAPVRIALGNNKSSNPLDKLIRTLSGAKQGEAVFSPTISAMTPFGDIQHLTQPVQDWSEAGGFSHPLRAAVAGTRAVASDVLNMSSPLIKDPVELATGENLFTGSKITNWQDWLVSQVGPGRAVLNANPTGGVNAHAITSQLLGLQVQPVTAARQKGEFRRREDVIQGMAKQMPTSRAAQWKNYLSRTRRSVGA